MRRAGLDPRVVLRLRREVRRLRPSVVVAHGGEAAKYAALAAPKDLPIVYLKIGTAHESLKRKANKGSTATTPRRADVVAAVSSDVAEEARLLYDVPQSRLHVLAQRQRPRGLPAS